MVQNRKMRVRVCPGYYRKVSAEVIIPKGFRADIERLTEYGIELGSGLSWIGRKLFLIQSIIFNKAQKKSPATLWVTGD